MKVEASRHTTRYRQPAALGLILLLACALRAYAVTRQALRGDEAFNVRFSAMPLSDMLYLMAHGEPHPPLQFLFLKVWMPIAGNSELAVRWPSVLAGVVTVTLTYKVGSALLGRPVGRLAALLAAFSPFLVWYSQDGRIYPFLAALVLAATYVTWQAARENRVWHWLAAGLLWLVAMSAHYLAALSLASAGLGLLLAPQTRPRWREALVMALVIGLAYLPWVLYVGPGLAGETKDWLTANAAWRFLTAFSVGTSDAGATPVVQIVGGGVLAWLLICGMAAVVRRDRSLAIWVALGAGGAPTGVWLFALIRSAFSERFAIASLPFALLLAAEGADALGRVNRWCRWLSGAAVAGLGLGAVLSLQNYFFDPQYSKSPNLRGIAAYLVQSARPDEVVILNQPDPSFYYYYTAPMPIETAPPGPLAQVGLPAAEAQLGALRDRYQHIRFFFAPNPAYDPDGFVGHWLETCCEKVSDTFVYGYRIQTFDTPTGSLAARQAHPVEFEAGINLLGFRVANPEIHPGETLHLTLYWTARQPVQASYTVFVHLLAADGFDVLDGDSLPRGGASPTDRWALGEVVIDPHPMPLPPDLPPGDYRLEAGLYLLATGQRLSGVDSAGQHADHITLPITVQVANP